MQEDLAIRKRLRRKDRRGPLLRALAVKGNDQSAAFDPHMVDDHL
jgi:hypothetical protein